MSEVSDLLDDSFLIHHLNPMFLDSLKKYWNTLNNATVSEEERIQIRDALYNLVRFAFRRLFQPLYLQYYPKMEGRIFLLSAVHSDGIGDYIATLKCAKLLKEQHPDLNVHVVYTHKQKLPPIDPAFYLLEKENIHDFQEIEDASSSVLGSVLEGKTEFFLEPKLEKLQQEREKIISEYQALEKFPEAASAVKELAEEMDKPIHFMQYFIRKKSEAEKLYSLMKESLALIHISLALNTFDNPALAAKSLYFAESGNFQGVANYLQRNWFSMGLEPFEEGVFFKKQKETANWMDVKFAQYLWKSENPTQAQFKDYLKDHSLYLGYLYRLPEQRHVFVEIICRRHIKDERHIDIILTKPEKGEYQNFDKEWMIAHGISKVVSVDCSQGMHENILSQIDLPSEKVLRLIYALPLPASDFLKLMYMCGEIVGCTGDGSLSDCMIAEKIPFYEVRKHKLRTLEAFKHLARILTLPDVLEYFDELERFANWPAISFVEKFEKILNDDSFKIQWKTMVDFIRNYYCFEDAFLAHVNRHLFSALSWEIIEKEEMLVEAFFEKAITAEDAYQTLEKMLKNRSTSI